MLTKRNRNFGLIISGVAVGWGESVSMQTKCIWFDAVEEIIDSDNWIVCNFKLFMCFLWYEFFSYHKTCGSSVKVNGISDDIRKDFMWQNATAVYTKKKLFSICRILHSLKFQVVHIVLLMLTVERKLMQLT